MFTSLRRGDIRAAGIAFVCLFPIAFPQGVYRRMTLGAYAGEFCGDVRGSSANAIEVIVVGHDIRVFVEPFKKDASIHAIHLHRGRQHARDRRWSYLVWERPERKKSGQGNHSERR